MLFFEALQKESFNSLILDVLVLLVSWRLNFGEFQARVAS